MTSAFPPGGTYFDGRKSFADVNYDTAKDNAINTTQFLEASESLTTLFDVIGGAAFKPVKIQPLLPCDPYAMRGEVRHHVLGYQIHAEGRLVPVDLSICRSVLLGLSSEEPW